ncbi:hypothetical protein POM88_020043 [Heracleum sosnowskyi]|uniref:Uncharacterized protein n=1 Tax=Heracleum sosnowskyi TaxID=360622 RepID=A0AAD8MSF3_9APIA|nr:hypothetical protein POM88_020043 [Heracleum sosnowskyi]
MGRNIARNDSPDEPEKHSRLWISKDICDVLKKKKGTEAVELWDQNMVSHVFGNDLTDKHLTKRLFKVYSEFGHQMSVYVSKVLDQKRRDRWAGWITESPYWTKADGNRNT